jgi:hypothetical protein
MIKEFDGLTQEEIDLMMESPVLVAILIAGADNLIDHAEIQEAAEIAKNPPRGKLHTYYKLIGEEFEEKMEIALGYLPEETEERNSRISSKLGGLNSILPKLQRDFACEFYDNLKNLAQRIAESSGGVLGYMAVGDEESQYIKLEMINDPNKFS